MDQNKQLGWWIGSIMFCALALVVGVMAHDRGVDQAIIDHLFDFHFDAGHVQEEIERHKAQEEVDRIVQAERQRRYNEFADEVMGFWRDSDNCSGGRGDGTYTPPENNGCRE